MNTKNTKTAVIILLLIANIFFIYNIINLKIESENIPSETIDNAVNILGSKGFLIDRSKIPSKKPVNLIYEGVYSQDIFLDIVKNFSEVSDEELEDSDMFVPAGISYAAGDYIFIFTDADYFRVSMIENSYTKTLKDYLVVNRDTGKTELEEETEIKTELLRNDNNFEENKLKKDIKKDIKKAEGIIKNFIKKYHGQDVKLGFEITGFAYDRQKNCERVLINQTVGGLPIDANTVYIEIHDGKVKYFSGSWYFGDFIAKHPMPLLDSVNILFKCMEIDGSIVKESGRLTEMNLEYTVMPHETDKFYLVPSWQIKFDSERKLSYNMITGNKN